MTVALDGMGGDDAPAVVVEGAALAARELGVRILLVGQPERLGPLLGAQAGASGIEIVPASEVVEMHEHPANAVRQKQDSSMVVGVRLVREGRAQAFVSAGNTGAVMAAGLFELRRIPGVDRPALAAVFPTRRGGTLLVDVGANADCRPEYLAQFGLMGSVYMERVFGISRPKVGLISNGEEETKGNALVQAARPKLEGLPINFVGNVEGKEIPAGEVDVAVCDGFVGNVILKLSEGLASAITGLIRDEIQASLVSKLFAVGVLPAFRRVRKRLDYAEYGGAPLLGLNGVCIVAHGRSNALAIKNAVRAAAQAVQQDVVGQIGRGLAIGPTTATATAKPMPAETSGVQTATPGSATATPPDRPAAETAPTDGPATDEAH
ncbi:MAG: phosphate acyltransferase PlsX [Chloroflexi bacterium]|nr:phosphate acyltransferase PlsX [Chloroflexota bacterium]